MSTPQFHTDPLSSTQGPHLFSTQNLSVQHRKPLSLTPESLSSTPKIPQFNTKKPHTKTPKRPESLKTFKVMQLTRKLFIHTIYLCFRVIEYTR